MSSTYHVRLTTLAGEIVDMYVLDGKVVTCEEYGSTMAALDDMLLGHDDAWLQSDRSRPLREYQLDLSKYRPRSFVRFKG